MQEKSQQVLPKENGLQKKSSTEISILPWKDEEKSALAEIIGNVFDLQKQYGKTTGQLENIVKGFLWAMKAYEPKEVIRGFGQYILSHSDMPTPFDIRQIIDPVQEPWRPDKSYYIKLQEIFKRDGPYGLNEDEIEYIQLYEAYMQKERKQSA